MTDECHWPAWPGCPVVAQLLISDPERVGYGSDAERAVMW